MSTSVQLGSDAMKFRLKPRAYPCEGGGTLITVLELLPRCRLKKIQSDDGKWQFVEGRTFIGKEYIYSPASRRVEKIHHLPSNTDRECEIVMVYDERGMFCMMPTECLDF